MLWDPRKTRNDPAVPGPVRANRAWDPAQPAPVADQGQIVPTKALRKFLGSLTSREAPVLMDLGPVVGSNITFFGERLGCKIIVEDLYGDLDRHTRRSTDPFADFLRGRLTQPAESVDGILCWNFFEYLDWPAAQVLGKALVRALRPDGALLAFFTTTAVPSSRFAKYVIMDEDTIRQKAYTEVGRKQVALQNRDVIRLFEGLKVSESFLLKTNIREFLFRKASI